MARKKRELIAELETYSARIRDRADKFYWRNIHVFDSKTHRLKSHIEDRTEAAQVLRVVEILGQLHERMKRLNADERKCLNGIGQEIPKEEPSSEK